MEPRRVIVGLLSLAFVVFGPTVFPSAQPAAQAQPQPGFVYVTRSDIAEIWRVNTASGEKSLLYKFDDPGFRAEDMVLDDYGILYVGGPGVGVKRIDTVSGTRLPDVGTNIQCPEGLSVGLSGSGDIYSNTRGSGYGCGAATGVWRIPGGTGQTAVQVAPQYSTFGEGTAFLRMPPFRGHLAIVDKTNDRVVRSSPADLEANNPPSPFITPGFSDPNGIAVRNDGLIFVSDRSANEIKWYSPDGTAIGTFASQLHEHWIMEFDEQGNLYVAENDAPGNLLKFDPNGTKTVLATDLNDIVGVAAPPQSPGLGIVVIHGWRSSCDGVVTLTDNLKEQFGSEWVDCYPYDYKYGVAQSAVSLANWIREDLRPRLGLGPEDPIHIVAHSMGGLVARYYRQFLYDPVDGPIGSISMLGTPNEGSWLAGIERKLCWCRGPLCPDVAEAMCGVAELLDTGPIDLDSQEIKDMSGGSDVLGRLNDDFVLPPSPVYKVHVGLNGSKLGNFTHPGQAGDCVVSARSVRGPRNVFAETEYAWDLSHTNLSFLVDWCDDETLLNSPGVVSAIIETINDINWHSGVGAHTTLASGGPGVNPPLAASAVNFVLPTEQKTHQLTVPPGLTDAAFSVMWLDGEPEPDLGFTLRRPDGTVVSPTDPDVIDQVALTGDGLFYVLMRGFSVTAPQAGDWEVTVEGLSVPEQGQAYLVALMPDSQVVLGVDMAQARLAQGGEQVVMATLYDGAAAIAPTSISATVQTPDGRSEDVALHDDGTGGDEMAGDLTYSATFTATGDCGGYNVLATANGSTSEGPATRQQMAVFEVYVAGDAVRNPCDPDDDGDLLTDIDEINVYGTNPLDPDTDGDGCAESEEVALGYNPLAWYDFYDVPVPAVADPTPNGKRTQVVDIGDVLAVLFYGFAEEGKEPNANGVDYDSDKGLDIDGDTVMDVPPDGMPDGRDYDRTSSMEPNPPWDAGPPNSVVDVDDVLAALAQAFVVDCSNPPPPGGQGASAGEGREPFVAGDGTSVSTPNAMGVDAASGGGVDSVRTVKDAGPFEVHIAITAAKEAYAGYQFVLSYDDQVLALLPTADVDRDGTLESWTYRPLDGATLDARVAQRDLDRDAAVDQAAGGSVLLSGATSATGVVASVRFQCVGDGTSPVHLVPPGEDAFGSTTFAPGGAAIDTSLADAWITCSVD